MSILKSRTSFPPGGWIFFEPSTNWSAPFPTSDTFDLTVQRIIDHRRNNSRFNLPTDYNIVANELEAFTAARLKNDPRWVLTPDTQKKTRAQAIPSIPTTPTRVSLVQRLRQLLKQGKVGKETLSEWIGEGGIPVSQKHAESRATICETCPKNIKGDFFDLIKGEVAELVKSQVESKNHLELKLPNEDRLGTCEVCGCHLGLKPWVPLKHIKDNMDLNEFDELPNHCWIKTEKEQKILVVIPYCNSDFRQTQKLLEWIWELGGCHSSPCLLVADVKVPEMNRNFILDLAKKSFGEVRAITTPYSLPNEAWPIGPNWMFQTTLAYVHNHWKLPFFWLEPDAVPLKAGWIEALENEYFSCGKPFMGAIVHSSGQDGLPGDHLTGVAVYPPNAYDLLKSTFKDTRAFDMVMAPIVVPMTHHTELHQHFWGQTNLAPVFKKDRSPDNPTNTLLLRTIRPDAVVFHRCKNSSLIDLLRVTK